MCDPLTEVSRSKSTWLGGDPWSMLIIKANAANLINSIMFLSILLFRQNIAQVWDVAYSNRICSKLKVSFDK